MKTTRIRFLPHLLSASILSIEYSEIEIAKCRLRTNCKQMDSIEAHIYNLRKEKRNR